jgi:hypothetical protein
MVIHVLLNSLNDTIITVITLETETSIYLIRFIEICHDPHKNCCHYLYYVLMIRV